MKSCSTSELVGTGVTVKLSTVCMYVLQSYCRYIYCGKIDIASRPYKLHCCDMCLYEAGVYICTLFCAYNSSALYILLPQALNVWNSCIYSVVCYQRYSIHMISCTDLFKAVVCLCCVRAQVLYTHCLWIVWGSASGVTSPAYAGSVLAWLWTLSCN